MKSFFRRLPLALILLTLTLFLAPSCQAKVRSITTGTNVSVSLGNFYFKLYGYTSPQGSVSISGMGVSNTTYANDEGYFEFNDNYSPLAPRELCLTTQDQFGRLTTPTCLPPFPVKYNITIGPVVMPPTISLDKKDYFIGDEVILSGQSIPNKEISMAVFTENKKSFIQGVEAFTFPNIKTKADSKGNFSFSLPSTSSKKYRLFTQVGYNEYISPKSLILNLDILPLWMIVIKILLIIWEIVKSRLLDLLLFCQAIYLVIYLVNYYFHPFRIMKAKSLILRPNLALTIQEHELTLIK